jgi:dolichol-phosphate mannosyltransferase
MTVAYTGFVVSAVGGILLIQTLVRYLLGRAAIGFTTVISIQIFLGGMILTGLGVIAVYLSRIYEEQKGRPLFIVRGSRTEQHKDVNVLHKRGRTAERDRRRGTAPFE